MMPCLDHVGEKIQRKKAVQEGEFGEEKGLPTFFLLGTGRLLSCATQPYPYIVNSTITLNSISQATPER